MPQSLRVFIAVSIPEPVACFLRDVQARLQLPATDVRWLAVKNIHLTLKFLGDVDPSRVLDVAARMDDAAGQIPPFSLKARGAGVFPDLRRARVLWVGLDGALEPLSRIQAALESGLESSGFKKESRRFHPHLTIGRTRRRIDAHTMGASLERLKEAVSDSFRVDRLGLFKSTLKPAGADYSLLHTSRLTA
jgi:2'-5' RNA ligase